MPTKIAEAHDTTAHKDFPKNKGDLSCEELHLLKSAFSSVVRRAFLISIETKLHHHRKIPFQQILLLSTHLPPLQLQSFKTSGTLLW
ncbi:hypothetical protein AVDCRST_MAG92-3087 [uncultured Coleofasciculus sp.]|uniref:Uncharacterized protein n=1 Tax=uncultured Coleofasciculus sp. TaxID=1267456 RepID=A0A6J4JCU7_9CYAN|nr:hypothetical protein AVDCRST_MAG92-3087 [uncultured Coleofasciculus sp.]